MRLITTLLFIVVIIGCSSSTSLDDDAAQRLYRISTSLACFDPGGYVVATDNRIEGTLNYSEYEEEVYRTIRTDIDSYVFSIPNGKYDVRLKFCEIEYFDTGKRVFDVAIQNQSVVSDLDIFSKVGGNTAYMHRTRCYRNFSG